MFIVMPRKAAIAIATSSPDRTLRHSIKQKMLVDLIIEAYNVAQASCLRSSSTPTFHRKPRNFYALFALPCPP